MLGALSVGHLLIPVALTPYEITTPLKYVYGLSGVDSLLSFGEEMEIRRRERRKNKGKGIRVRI
jgi:hypothetical protein